VEPKDVPAHDIEFNQYLYLVAVCNDPQMVFYKEVKILLSYKDKIVLVQTDKPVYTPLQTVKIRVIPLDFALKSSKDKVNVAVKNPQDVIARQWGNLSSETGFITKALYLGDHSMIGNWTIVTTYGYLNSQNTSIKFEVKEYVLPKFSVRIVGPSYILPSTKTISIALIAKYTFGKPVKGDAMLRLAVTGKGLMEVKFFANSTQLRDGKVLFKVDTNLIKKHVLLPRFPDGRRLRIEADVVEQATGVRESAIDSSIYFVTTPYHLSYENTAMYFKPSLPYTIKVDVKYPNKKTASGIIIQVKALGTNKDGASVELMGKVNDMKRKFLQDKTTPEGQAEFTIDVPRDVISIKIQVETKDLRIPEDENAAIDFTAKAYNSETGSYLHIRHRKSKGIVRTTSIWDVFQNRNITALNFMVISRGRILVQANSRPEHGINVVSTMRFQVTMEMSPRCRVLAYYVTRDNEVVADSAVLQVEQLFPNKVFKEVKSLDGGCGVGPGKDNVEVFEFEVRLEGDRGFCSEAIAGVQSKPIKFSVKGNDVKSVTFPIVPVQLGKIQVKVSATQKVMDMDDLSTTDTVHRELLVVPEGVERRLVQSLVLDPQGVLRDEKPTVNHNSSTPAPTLKSFRIVQDGHQIDTVMLRVPSRAIPGSLRASIYLTGNLIGPVVTNLIKGGLDNILRMPLGCGEQNMIYLAPNVYVLEYLTNTKQVTSDVEARAYRFIQQGYQQELGFRRKDKSFSAFGESRPGSTWLTAFVIKVFCAAQRFEGIAVDENLVCESVSWLLSNQRPDGAFPEVHDIIHKSLLGGVHGNVAMTAFVLTALLECKCSTQNSIGAVMKAIRYLEQEITSLDKAHILALTTYSLALAKSPLGAKANHRLMLMSAFDKGKGFNRSKITITPFLGGELFIDSLGTGVGQMQVEIVYNVPSSKNETCLFDVSVSVKEAFDDNRVDDSMFVMGRSASRQKRDLRSRKRKRKCRKRNKKRCRKGKKNGNGKKKKQKKNEKKGKKKKSKKEKKQKTQGRAPDSLYLKICTRYRKPGKSGMTIMDIGIFTGFQADEKSLVEVRTSVTPSLPLVSHQMNNQFSIALHQLKKNVRPTVDRFEFSDRSIVLYISEVSSAKEFCAAFKVNRVFGVGAVQPVPIKVYDYYEPGDACTRFYSPDPKSELRLGICKGEQCKCTQDGCTSCNINFHDVNDMTKTCKDHEFVIKGQVVFVDEERRNSASWLTYFVEIQQIFKQRGSTMHVGGVIEYKKRTGCKCPELNEMEDYLIMGQEQGAQLILDKNTVVVPWKGGKTRNEIVVLREFRARMNQGNSCP
ncbi:hypothetical protein QZH41_009569, partial [Actinostola sp. cb2023]